ATFLVIVGVGASIGFSLFPKADTPHFLITIDGPNGISLAETDRALRFVEGELAKMPEVESYFSNLGHGNPKIYYNQLPPEERPNYGDLYVKLRSYDTRRTPMLLDQLRGRLKEYPNARIYVREFQNGPPITAPIAIRVVGPGIDELHDLAAQVEQLMRSTPGLRDVENPVRVTGTNLRLKVDDEKAAMLGVPAVELDRAVRLSVSGVSAGKYKDTDGEQYDIMVRTPIGARSDIS